MAFANVNDDLGDEAAGRGQHVLAALNYTQAAANLATENDLQLTNLMISKAINSLNKAGPDTLGPDEVLDGIIANLQAVDAASPQDADVSSRVQQVRSLVEKFRSRRAARSMGPFDQ
jgi:hypothetical protein